MIFPRIRFAWRLACVRHHLIGGESNPGLIAATAKVSVTTRSIDGSELSGMFPKALYPRTAANGRPRPL